MKKYIPVMFFLALFLLVIAEEGDSQVHIRVNQVGYLSGENKSAVIFSHEKVKESFAIVKDGEGRIPVKAGKVLELKAARSAVQGWGRFSYYYTLDFSGVERPGSYYLEGLRSGIRSAVFRISDGAYGNLQEELLGFMRQQRCGYNPFLDEACHRLDGRSFYGPMPDSTYIDVSGGWHDAGDQLKYLITSSYATAHMLLAYELYPDRFEDRYNALGQSGSNGIPDVLDEAKWGLDWIHKLHPAPGQLVHQVADDRDHIGWKMPGEDPSEYGWGKNSYRAAYFATGEPQGLLKYKSEATGVSNLAGRSAAAMAMASRIWKEKLGDQAFSEKCLQAARSLYVMGKEKEGFQQGNSYSQPYRYGEASWADDMEWGAAELFRCTGDSSFFRDAVRYARLAATDTWMPHDTALHYQYYPFVNMGHFALHRVAGAELQKELVSYYREGIESCLGRGESNPFGVGVPFIWCSNNLLSSLAAQCILYGHMTGDDSYEDFLVLQRDWLLGRNPWGTSMFTGIPSGGEYPEDVHTSIYVLTGKEVAGGLVDGPVYGTIYRSLLGLRLDDPDEFEHLQNPYVVYHDDVGDYSTNEPTMDGTAGAILMMVHFSEK